MSVVFWDTNLFIYLWEDFGKLSGQVLALRKRMLTRGDELFTSAMTLGEILVKPIQSGDAKAVAYYQNLIATTATVIPLRRKSGDSLRAAAGGSVAARSRHDPACVCGSSGNRSLHHQRCTTAFDANSWHPVHRSARSRPHLTRNSQNPVYEKMPGWSGCFTRRIHAYGERRQGPRISSARRNTRRERNARGER